MASQLALVSPPPRQGGDHDLSQAARDHSEQGLVPCLLPIFTLTSKARFWTMSWTPWTQQPRGLPRPPYIGWDGFVVYSRRQFALCVRARGSTTLGARCGGT